MKTTAEGQGLCCLVLTVAGFLLCGCTPTTAQPPPPEEAIERVRNNPHMPPEVKAQAEAEIRAHQMVGQQTKRQSGIDHGVPRPGAGQP